MFLSYSTSPFLRRIVQDETLWCKVNLSNRTQSDNSLVSDASIRTSTPNWSFPADESKVLQLAQAYFGQKLETLHLHVVNTNILKYLCGNCPSLESIVLYHDKMALKHADLSFLPPNLKTLDLCLKGCFKRPTHRWQSQCKFGVTPLDELRSLTIRYTEFFHVLFERLSNFGQLEELILHHCSDLTIYGFSQLAEGVPDLKCLWFRYCAARSFGMLEFREILYSVPLKFKHLRSFKLQSITNLRDTIPIDNNDTTMLNGLVSLTNLRSLWLENVDIFTSEHLCRLVSSLTELRELELVNDNNVTAQVLVNICTHLPHLNRLNVKGAKNVTDVGMRSLANHTTLKYLNVQGCSLSYDVICDTVLTMRQIQALFLNKDTSDEFCLCTATLKDRLPHLRVEAYMGP